MPLNDLFPTSLGAVQKDCFYDPANPTNIYTCNINPISDKRKPGNLRKYVATTNSTSVILGAVEGPPVEISLTWPMLDSSQVDLLVPFTQLSPIVYTDNNDLAYLGVLCIDSIEQLANYTRKIYAVTASFLVISPYSGLHSSLPQLTAPTITATLSGSAGYIPVSTNIYLWMSVFTSRSATSESVVGLVTHISNSTPLAAYSLSWTPPSNLYYNKARIYYNSSNSPTTSTLLTEILSGFPSDVPNSFTLYNSYVAYNLENPVLYGTCFPGFWGGSRWQAVP